MANPCHCIHSLLLLLNLVTITSDPKDIHMHCPDVTLRSIRSRLSHVASLSTYNYFILFYVRFYHCMCIHFSVSTVTCTCVMCYIKYHHQSMIILITFIHRNMKPVATRVYADAQRGGCSLRKFRNSIPCDNLYSPKMYNR